ncbi:fimbrial protein [Bacteroides timonensis]|uniref:fimbrial protein n=1 Tax=Bacteroides timonensis TaxID=1470345 RepID=UPI0004AF8D43|nr:fimbrial protein [Bacteroides timonensis]
MMKKKNMLWMSALLALLAGCSQNELGIDDTPTGGAQGKEIRLVFSGGGESQEYTRAIASESENQIDNLDIYVFAATTEGGDYQYLETWKAAAEDNTPAKTFKLSGAGTARKASIFPTELKGIPNLKLYCVANSTTLYKADGTAIDPLTAVTTNAASGAIEIPGTKAEDFEKYFTSKLTTASTPLGTPLVMTGSGTTKILGNIATVNIELKRRVSRFDIDNESAKTGLIIESVSLGNGRHQSTVMPGTLTDIPEGERATNLIQYPIVEGSYLMLPKANQGVTESALYTYPLKDTDKAFLIIKGKYQNPMQKDPVPVEYHLDIQRVPDGGGDPKFMDVEANTRYTLHIKEVMEATITAFFEIVDWTSGGGVIIKPDNAAPVVTALNVEGTDKDVTTKEISVTADGTEKTITLTATASGKVQPKFSTTTGWPIAWLEHDDASYQSEVVDGVTTSTMTFKYTLTANSPYVPITLTLANESASQDESVYTTLTIVPPATAPVLDFATPDADTGNFNLYDKDNNKLTMYKTSKSSITLGASCPFGTKLVLSNQLPWLEVAKSKTGPTPSTTGTPTTDVPVDTPVEEFYTLMLKDVTATSDADSKFEIINLGDEAKKLELTVELLDPAITAIELANAGGAAYSEYKITDVARAAASTIEVKVTSPQGVTANTLSSWFTVAETTAFARNAPSDATGTQTFTLTVKSNVTDFTPAPIVLKNNIAGMEDVTVLVSPAAPVP